ncbi:MAG: ABC transporter ATP-binding protein [Candidatus Lokiarchaeota archaeon]|nr:ABC transporter ATP-binding protein [Candidatus Lokiarchaeota archaeon]
MIKISIIKTKNLTKFYGKHRGIENLNLEVQEGEIFGFLGPNGAGKTTTIRTLLGLLNKTSGKSSIFGIDTGDRKNSVEIRKKIAYLPGELGLYTNMTSRQNLKFLLSLYDVEVDWAIVEELASRMHLDMDKKVRELSKGNKQKIGNILVLAPEVNLYILDEPTSGLDPLMQNEFYKILKERKKQADATVFLSSHLLPEVEKVADRVGIIRKGTLVEVSSIASLKKMALKRVEIFTKSNEDAKNITNLLPTDIIQNQQIDNSRLIFLCPTTELPLLIEQFNRIKSQIQDLQITSPALEDIFFQYYESEKDQKEKKK